MTAEWKTSQKLHQPAVGLVEMECCWVLENNIKKSVVDMKNLTRAILAKKTKKIDLTSGLYVRNILALQSGYIVSR